MFLHLLYMHEGYKFFKICIIWVAVHIHDLENSEYAANIATFVQAAGL